MPTRIPGTGGLWTTARDLIRLSRALFSFRLLQPPSVDAMMTPHATFDTVPIGDPRVTAGAYGCGTWLGAVRGRRAAIQPGDKPTLRDPLDLLWGERAG